MKNCAKTIEAKRSAVRIRVTYLSAVYVFAGSALLIGGVWFDKLTTTELEAAKDIFLTVLPVATGVITYWFASRKPVATTNQHTNEKSVQENENGGTGE